MLISAEEKPFLALFDNYTQVGEVVWIGIRPASRKTMLVQKVGNITELGLEGDRSTKNAPTNKRQVTLIQSEHLDAVASFLGVSKVDPALIRRNIVVKSINLYAIKGRQFKIGNATLEMTGFCYPCSRMEENLGKGGFNAMRGHGGITCRVIGPGEIAIGNKVEVL